MIKFSHYLYKRSIFILDRIWIPRDPTLKRSEIGIAAASWTKMADGLNFVAFDDRHHPFDFVPKLGGGNSKIFYFTSRKLGMMNPIWLLSYFSDGLVQPPTRKSSWHVMFEAIKKKTPASTSKNISDDFFWGELTCACLLSYKSRMLLRFRNVIARANIQTLNSEKWLLIYHELVRIQNVYFATRVECIECMDKKSGWKVGFRGKRHESLV